MSIDALAYGIQGRTGRFGQVDALSLSTLGKLPKITSFIIGLPLGVTIEIDSNVLRVMSADSLTCRDFLIIGRDDTGSNLLAKELTSETMRSMNLNTQVLRDIDILSITEVEDE